MQLRSYLGTALLSVLILSACSSSVRSDFKEAVLFYGLDTPLADSSENQAAELTRDPSGEANGSKIKVPLPNIKNSKNQSKIDCRGGSQIESGKFLTEGTQGFVSVIEDNEEAWLSRLKMIENAKESIVTTYYIISDDRYGFAFLGALMKKAQEGVKVRLMVDAFGTPKLSKSFLGRDNLQALVEAGAEVVIFAPMLSTLRPRLMGSNHDKILVVDDCFTLTGGRNIAARYFVDHAIDPIAFSDTDILVESRAVAKKMHEGFDLEYNLRRNDIVRNGVFGTHKKKLIALPKEFESALFDAKANPKWNSALRPDISGLIQTFDNSSKHQKNQIRDVSRITTELIDSAREEVVIRNPYVVLVPEVREALVQAARKKVKIFLLTNSPISSDSVLTQAAFSAEWPQLLKEIPTMRIFVGKGPDKLHSKVMAIDASVALIGTFNLDPISDHLNSEEVVVVEATQAALNVLSFIKDYIKRNTVEYRIENGKAIGPELLGNPAKVKRVQNLEGSARLLRDKL